MTATPEEVGTRENLTSTTVPQSESSETPGARFYIAVSAVARTDERRDLCEADPDERVRFERLSDAKQQEFLRALDEGRTRADAWTTGTPYVSYNGSWYKLTLLVEQ